MLEVIGIKRKCVKENPQLREVYGLVRRSILRQLKGIVQEKNSLPALYKSDDDSVDDDDSGDDSDDDDDTTVSVNEFDDDINVVIKDINGDQCHLLLCPFVTVTLVKD